MHKATSCFRLITLLLISLCLTSCNMSENILYSRFINFGEKGPGNKEFYQFDIKPDSLSCSPPDKCTIMLMARYTHRFESLYLPLEIETTDIGVDSTVNHPLMKIPLFNALGDPLGRRRHGIFEICDTLFKNTTLAEMPSVSVHALLENTEGINSIGIIVIKDD